MSAESGGMRYQQRVETLPLEGITEMNDKKVGLMKNDGWLLVLIVVVALA